MSNSNGRKKDRKTGQPRNTCCIEQGRYQALPQVAEGKIPQPMDVAGEFCLYDECAGKIN